MIRSFRHKGLEQYFADGSRRRLQAGRLDRIDEVLTALQFARSIEEINRPAFRLHPLKGELKGMWAVTVRAN